MKKKKSDPVETTISADIEETTSRIDAFPIVGIGASAGGLAAFEAFFSGMPADAEPGMGFVLVQHLAQDQHERAIGVVLSGTGSDGTLGLPVFVVA